MCVNANAYNNALWVQWLTFNTWNSTWTLHSIINASAGCVLQLIICNINSITSTSFVFNFKRPSRGKNTFEIKGTSLKKTNSDFLLPSLPFKPVFGHTFHFIVDKTWEKKMRQPVWRPTKQISLNLITNQYEIQMMRAPFRDCFEYRWFV